MKKNFDISLVDPLLFAGSNDRNIKLIENKFSTNIVLRGTQVKLDGKKDEINIISNIFDNMISVIEAKGYIEESELHDFINSTNLKNEITFDTDEEPLKFSKEKITKLRPAFSKDGTITAFNPDPQTLFIVKHSVLYGKSAPRAACLAGAWPKFADKTLPIVTDSILFLSRLFLVTNSLITHAPKSVAFMELRDPWKAPIAVLV